MQSERTPHAFCAWHGLRAAITRAGLPLTFLFLLIEFFDELHFGAEGAVLPALRQDLGLSYAQVGLLLGLPGLLNSVFELVIMLLGDTPLRKRLIVGGGLGVAAATLLIAGAHSFELVLLAFIVVFPASGAFVTLSQATLIDLNPGREAQVMARWTVAGALGNLLGPALIAAGFALAWGWRWAYVALAALALALAALVWRRVFPARSTTAADDTDDSPVNENPTTAQALRAVLADLRPALRNTRLLRWFVLLDLADLMLDVFVSYAALYFADVIGFNAAQVSLMVGAMMAASLVGNLLLVPLLERVQPLRLLRWTALSTLLVYIAWLALPWPAAKIGLAILLRLTTQGWYETLQGQAYAAMPGRSGTVMAISSLFGLLGGGLIWFVGWFAAQQGLSSAMWLLLLGPLALLLFVPYPRRTPHAQAEINAAGEQQDAQQ